MGVEGNKIFICSTNAGICGTRVVSSQFVNMALSDLRAGEDLASGAKRSELELKRWRSKPRYLLSLSVGGRLAPLESAQELGVVLGRSSSALGNKPRQEGSVAVAGGVSLD